MNKFKQFIHEFFVFGLKQAYACMFGGFLLAVMLVTKYWYPIEGLHRYDFIFLAAIAFQVFMLVFKLETWKEALVIIVFHLVATVMELLKLPMPYSPGTILKNSYSVLPMCRYLPALCTVRWAVIWLAYGESLISDTVIIHQNGQRFFWSRQSISTSLVTTIGMTYVG